MTLEELRPAEGSTKTSRRVGRGPGSGRGKTAARGHKGAKSRSGYSRRRGFEGGQMPLIRRVPKRGFNNIFAKQIETVNVSDLERFPEGTVVTPAASRAASAASGRAIDAVKVLGKGELKKKLVVQAHAFSAGAKVQDRVRRGNVRGAQGVIESLKNIFRIPDLRNRVLFTLGMLAVYRLGNHIPTPGVDARALTEFFEQNRGTWFGFVDMFSGGNLSRVTVFALGIMPYISASIILQLLTVVWPYLEKLSKEGELGRKKITQYTRYGTVLLSVVQSAGIAAFLQKTELTGGLTLVANPGHRIHRHDDAHPHGGHRLHHVDRRADHRARRRQRHVAPDFRGHRRRRFPQAIVTTIRQHLDGRADRLRNPPAHRVHGGRRRRHRLRRAGPATHSGAIRQARRGTKDVSGAVDAPAPEGEYRRRHSRDLRELDHRAAADVRLDVPRQRLDDERRPAAGLGHASVHPDLCRRYRLLLLFLHRHHLQPRRRRRQHEEVRRLRARNPPRQADRGVHRQHPDATHLWWRDLSRRGVGAPGVHDRRVPSGAHPDHRPVPRLDSANLDYGRDSA